VLANKHKQMNSQCEEFPLFVAKGSTELPNVTGEMLDELLFGSYEVWLPPLSDIPNK
jgi:hypothetical protein